MIGCYAHSLGNCKGKLSSEHIVSESILGKIITVRGFNWCLNEPKHIGSSNLTVKNLCQHHNAELSLTDEAIKIYKQGLMRYDKKLGIFNKHGLNHRKGPDKFHINGYVFEK